MSSPSVELTWRLPSGPPRGLRSFAFEGYAVARYSVLIFLRYPMWALNLALGPFLAMAPFVFLGDTVVGRGQPLQGRYFEGSGYTDYIGFLVVPLIAVGLTNTVFSWVGGLIRMERNTGTLERILISLKYPVNLFIGRTLAHLVFIAAFTISTLLLAGIWLKPDFNIDPIAGLVVVVLHLGAAYGMAFALSSALIRMEDSFFFQAFISKALLAVLAGASFPIAIFPGWLQVIAKVFPFTWAFDLERRALLRAEPLSQMVPDVLVLTSMTVAMWAIGFLMLGRELNAAKRTGVLGRY